MFVLILKVNCTAIIMFSGSLSPRNGVFSGCGWIRRPPDM